MKKLYLSINNKEEDQESSHKVIKIGWASSIESLIQSIKLILLSCQKMEKCDDSSFELCSRLGLNCDRTECSPDNILTNIRSNEERDTRAQTVAFLHHFIKHNDDNTSKNKLEDDEHGISNSQGVDITIDTRPNISKSLTNANNKRKDYFIS